MTDGPYTTGDQPVGGSQNPYGKPKPGKPAKPSPTGPAKPRPNVKPPKP